MPSAHDNFPDTTVYSTAGLEGISVPSVGAITKIEHDHLHKVSVTSHPSDTKEVRCVAAVTKRSANVNGERTAKGVEPSDRKLPVLANDLIGEGPIVASIEIKVRI